MRQFIVKLCVICSQLCHPSFATWQFFCVSYVLVKQKPTLFESVFTVNCVTSDGGSHSLVPPNEVTISVISTMERTQ